MRGSPPFASSYGLNSRFAWFLVQGYSEFRLTRYPTLTHLINEYSQGKDPVTSMGPHWEQPGRSILDNHLLDVPKGNAVAPDAFEDEDRVYFAGE